MKDIYKALQQFKHQEFEPHRALYESLSDTQTPHTLFIGCSDSRVSPERLLQAYPGEIFHIRNIANMVPKAGQSVKYASTTSAIEYAVEVLGVKNIIVCGHSNCGGCMACIQPPESIDQLPYTKIWISQLEPLKKYLDQKIPHADNATKASELERLNVVQQLKNLRSFKHIREKVVSGQLHISGWHYSIGEGAIRIYDELSQQFKEI